MKEDGRADSQCRRAVDGHGFGGDVALIVIHHHASIVALFVKYRGGAVGAVGGYPRLPRIRDRGRNQRFVIAEHAAFSRVRVESRHGHAWHATTNADALERSVARTYRMQYRSRVTSSITRRRLTCNVVCTMRVSRPLWSKQIIRNASSTGVPVRATRDEHGVTVEFDAGHFDCGFGPRCGNHGIDFAAHRRFDGRARSRAPRGPAPPPVR